MAQMNKVDNVLYSLSYEYGRLVSYLFIFIDFLII